MTEREENRILAVAIGVLVTLIVLCCLCSCGTRKTVTETLYVHDTLRIAQSDTIIAERWNYKRDTVRVESERIVTLLQGDKTQPPETIRIVTNNNHFERVETSDSTVRLASRIDSLLRMMDRDHEREKTVTKTSPVIDLWQYAVFLSLIFLPLYFVVKSK